MKTAILTFQESTNNGALLQAFALQQILTEINNGEASEIINYHSSFKESQYKVRYTNSLKVYLNKLLSIPIQKKLKIEAEKFKNKKLNITPKIYNSSKELEILNDSYRKFVTGSDQVWNPVNTGEDFTYLLDFVKNSEKKVSYAPSIAIENLEESLKPLYRKHLSTFSHLSIREISGKKIVDNLIDSDIPVVLDPTLLLTKDEWKNQVSGHAKPKNKYIFVYYISYSKELIQFVKRLKEETGLEVIVATKTLRDIVVNRKNNFKSEFVGPDKFVNFIHDAEFVVTNSFHGTVFSVNFEKNFFTFGNKKKLSKANSRITDFLKLTGLDKRYIEGGSEVNLKTDSIDYNEINKILIKERSKSLKYLQEAIKSNN